MHNAVADLFKLPPAAPPRQYQILSSGCSTSNPAACKAPGKAEADHPSAQNLATELGDLNGVPGSWLLPGADLAFMAI